MNPSKNGEIMSPSSDVLHTSLLCGTLSIKVTEMDIRRVGGSADLVSALSSLSPIETDYILKIQSANNDVSRNNITDTPHKVQKIEAYSCSKRYVDMRDLSNKMHDHAQEIVKYYEDRKNNTSSGGRGRTTVVGTLETLLQKPVEVAQFITNTEPKNSHLVSDLDNIFRGDGRRKTVETDSSRGRKKIGRRRSSELLDQRAPPFVREIVVGVDEFYDAIYSEKRQFGSKTNYDHVKSVAERRKTIINRAFSLLIDAISAADLASVSAGKPDLIPVSLEVLVKSLEKFLLTDVVVDREKESTTVGEKRVPLNQESVDGSIANSAVRPMTTRRRASILDREAEERKCQDCGELVMCLSSEEKEDIEDFIAVKSSASEAKDTGVQLVPRTGLLPSNPKVIIAVGAILFKALEGWAVNIQMDMILVFGIACGLIGYQLAGGSTTPSKKVAMLPLSSVPEEKAQDIPERRSPRPSSRPSPRPSRRTLLAKSSGSLSLESDQDRRKSLLIQASLRNVKSDRAMHGEEEKPVVPASTFPMFPDGEAIGSHLNCWSSPASTNFHVRGPNYLKDKKKVPSGDYLFPCRGCDLFLTDNAPVNLGRNRSILEGKLRDIPTFIINYRLPWGVFISYHEIPERFLPFLRRGHGYGDASAPLPSMSSMSAGDRAACNFLLSDAEEKSQVWKIVPVVVEGPWVVKRVVGGKPAIIGTKLPIQFVYQPPENGLSEYLEADLDIVSSAAARNILAVVRSYTQVLTIDLGYVVQGNKQEELPEQMMLGLRLHGLDPLTAELLPGFDDGTAMPELDEDTGNETE